MGNTLTFLHLSDIHFDAATGDVLDMNRDLRNQLQRDVKNELKTRKNKKGDRFIFFPSLVSLVLEIPKFSFHSLRFS